MGVLGLGCGVALFSFLLLVSVGPYFQNGPSAGAPESAFKAQLDESVPRIIRHFKVPGVVIATVVAGAPAKTYAYGYADVAGRRPMRADTVFRVASISKSVTAWGVLSLVQSGKIGLDQPASRYLRRWPLPATRFPIGAVTVRRLLNHTSGLNAGEDSFHAPDQPAPSALALLARQGQGPKPGSAMLVAPAGRNFVYSVPGYTLLQLMVEQQSGLPFQDYMRKAVLQPLGMESSSFAWDGALRPLTATPYRSDGKALAMQVADDAAADSLFASAPDLARFVAAPMPDRLSPAGAGLLGEAIVHDAYLDHEQVPNLGLASVAPDAPGPGFFVESAPGQPTLLTNVGFDPGWSSLFMMSPSTGDGVVILTNSDAGAPAIAQITSIWSSWRGLPAPNLTSLYRRFGLSAALFLSVLAALDVAYAGGLISEAMAGRRRFALVRASSSGVLLELVVTATVLVLWAGVFAAVHTMPTLSAVGVTVIGTLVVVALARVAFPIQAGPTGPPSLAAA